MPYERKIERYQTLLPMPHLLSDFKGQYAHINGISFYYTEGGIKGGDPVFMLHGGLANSDYWGHQVKLLVKIKHVFVIDSREVWPLCLSQILSHFFKLLCCIMQL